MKVIVYVNASIMNSEDNAVATMEINSRSGEKVKVRIGKETIVVSGSELISAIQKAMDV